MSCEETSGAISKKKSDKVEREERLLTPFAFLNK
jgi:hypothetical protein